MSAQRLPCIVGVGNPWRRDDGVGLVVVQQLRGRVDDCAELVECSGDLSTLICGWKGRALVIVVDAMRSGAPPGSMRSIDLLATAEGSAPRVRHDARHSTHALGLGAAVRLAAELDLLPDRLTCHAIEVADVDYGVGLSAAVAAAVPALAERIIAEVAAADAQGTERVRGERGDSAHRTVTRTSGSAPA